MPTDDPNPLPYGALQYYQVHYIVQVESEENDAFLARCEPIANGHIGHTQVVGVQWVGLDEFAAVLQGDEKLTEMLKEVMLREGEVRVDPLGDHIRIYGKWNHEDKFAFNETMLEIADRIAMHIRQMLRNLGVKA
ncbi:MAG: hypothetical protein MN733_10165 [Nitrososphaera sp.]|nr:hypothetical protein [Nitrososphaera sp.]